MKNEKILITGENYTMYLTQIGLKISKAKISRDRIANFIEKKDIEIQELEEKIVEIKEKIASVQKLISEIEIRMNKINDNIEKNNKRI